MLTLCNTIWLALPDLRAVRLTQGVTTGHLEGAGNRGDRWGDWEETGNGGKWGRWAGTSNTGMKSETEIDGQPMCAWLLGSGDIRIDS